MQTFYKLDKQKLWAGERNAEARYACSDKGGHFG